MSVRTVYLDDELETFGPSVSFDGNGGILLRGCGEAGQYLTPVQTAMLARALFYRYDCDRPDCDRPGMWQFGDQHLCREHATDYRQQLSIRVWRDE